jgi:hypothetical protein
MTLRDLVRGQTTETQYELFQRADRMFADRFVPVLPAYGGRHFGGQLTEEQVAGLTARLRLRQGEDADRG